MAKLLEFTEDELIALTKAIDYFRKAEETEISELSSYGGNKEYIPGSRQRLDIFESILKKLGS